LNKDIIKEYDIRGVFGKNLTEEDAYFIGRAFASYIIQSNGKHSVFVARDGRLSSSILEENLIKGLLQNGMNVVILGLVPTPVLYYACATSEAGHGLMITGSHNPPEYNGFKMVIAKEAIYGETIKQLCATTIGNTLSRGEKSTSYGHIQQYLQKILAQFSETQQRKLKVAWDPANGATCSVLLPLRNLLKKQGIISKDIVLNGEVDGTFPSHPADPSVARNMRQLQEAVLKHKCDLGIAFDGDGDRVGLIDDQGNIVHADQLIMLFAQDILQIQPKAKVVVDIKTSLAVFDWIKKLGGETIMWKTGHSLIKNKMKQEGAVLAGEASGHIFFTDNFGYDDGIFAAARVLRILSTKRMPLSKLLSSISKYYATPEIRVECEEKNKLRIVNFLKQEVRAKGKQYNDLDGIRVDYPDGWWLLRPSNTQECLVIRAEGKTQSAKERMIDELRSMLLTVDDKLVDLLDFSE
jgi:phosphomannomutase